MADKAEVLTFAGQPTGQILYMAEIHDQELRHGTSHLWLVNTVGQILMQYRVGSKKIFPNCWDTAVAGHVDPGETALDAVLREAQEEIGLTVLEQQVTSLAEFPEDLPMTTGKLHREWVSVFGAVTDFDINQLVLQKSELTGVKLFSPDEVEDMLRDPQKRLQLSGHKDELFELVINLARGS